MIFLDWLIRPGRGRRRLTIPGLLADNAALRQTNTDLLAQLALRDGLAQVYCYDRDEDHPVWFTAGGAPTPRCPWCALRAKDRELAFYRQPIPAGPPLVPAPKDQPHWGEDSSTTASTRRDTTLAGLAVNDTDQELLTALGLSIPAADAEFWPDGSQATTAQIPLLPPLIVRLAKDPAPRIRAPEACATAAVRAVAAVQDQLDHVH